MSQRVVTVISVGLTAFVLVVGGAVAGSIAQTAGSMSDAAEEPSAALETVDSAEVSVFMDREAEYRSLISQANERLKDAYAQRRINTAFSSSEVAFSLDQAAEIALQAVPGAILLQPPELVNFLGVMAYEIALDKGMVYVDANTGEILYNAAVNDPEPQVAADKQGDDREPSQDKSQTANIHESDRSDDGGHDREDEHEQEHEEDHEDSEDPIGG